jgi:hypothetical protein
MGRSCICRDNKIFQDFVKRFRCRTRGLLKQVGITFFGKSPYCHRIQISITNHIWHSATMIPGRNRKVSPLKLPGMSMHAAMLCPVPDSKYSDRPCLALGLEGSANKLGAGVIKHAKDGSTSVLSNVRHTYITPPGEGFQPRDTAQHHRDWAINVIKDALHKAGLSMQDLDCICYTKGLHILLLSQQFFTDCVSRPWHGCAIAGRGTSGSNALIAL